MKSVTQRCIQLLLVMVGIVGSFAAQAAYEFTNVDPPGATFTQLWGINNSGRAVGNAATGTGDISFLHDSKKGSYTILAPYSDPAELLGINESGVTVGISDDGNVYSGLIRSKAGGYTSFSHPDCVNTHGRAVSTTGLVSGYADTCTIGAYSVGFIYDPASDTFTDFLPSPITIAQGINGRGQVVGSTRLPPNGAYPGSPSGTYAFLRESNGTISFFRVNSQSTRARGITDSGRIVGFFTDIDTGLDHGFVGSLAGLPGSGQNIPDVELLDVPSSWATPDYVIISTFPQGINDAGVIVGGWTECLAAVVAVSLNGCNAPGNSKFHGFIATPVPPKKK
jgi:hypothetical protein